MSNIEHQSATMNDAPATPQADSSPAKRTTFPKEFEGALILAQLLHRIPMHQSGCLSSRWSLNTVMAGQKSTARPSGFRSIASRTHRRR